MCAMHTQHDPRVDVGVCAPAVNVHAHVRGGWALQVFLGCGQMGYINIYIYIYRERERYRYRHIYIYIWRERDV